MMRLRGEKEWRIEGGELQRKVRSCLECYVKSIMLLFASVLESRSLMLDCVQLGSGPSHAEVLCYMVNRNHKKSA